jgi:hypothetical protein
MVTIPCRNVPVVCGASYHLLGYQILQDSKILFRLQVESYISNWLFSESRLLASYVSRHKAMAYDNLKDMVNRITSLTEAQRKQFLAILIKNNRVFQRIRDKYIGEPIKLKLKSHATPVWNKPNPTPFKHRVVLERDLAGNVGDMSATCRRRVEM